MSRAIPAPTPARAAAGGADKSLGYFGQSQLPLTSLVFLLPLVIIYELGVCLTGRANGGAPPAILAFTFIQQFFGVFGANGRHLPAMAVVGILLAWHIARNDAWSVHLPTLLGMVLESLALTLPLIALGGLLSYSMAGGLHLLPLGPFMLSLGAGIYEELVFRLALFSLLSLVLGDMLRVPKFVAGPIMIIGSALLFAGYHHLGSEVFNLRNFAFRTLAGIYFGAIFLSRGFGITAASHAAYDLLIVSLYMPASYR